MACVVIFEVSIRQFEKNISISIETFVHLRSIQKRL